MKAISWTLCHYGRTTALAALCRELHVELQERAQAAQMGAPGPHQWPFWPLVLALMLAGAALIFR